MKPLCLLLVGVVVGWAASGVDWSREAYAKEESVDTFTDRMPIPGEFQFRMPAGPSPIASVGHVAHSGLVGRYQASAYGSPSGHGCYIVDTMTGRTWHSTSGHPPQVVVESLSPQATPAPASAPTILPPMIVPQPMSPEPTPDAAD